MKRLKKMNNGALSGFLVGGDALLSVTALLMSLYGVVMIFSASHTFGTSKYVVIQLAAVVLGYFSMLVVSRLRYKTFIRYTVWLLFLAAVGMLAVTLLIGTGDGNRSWIRFSFMPIGFQPSEFVKILFVMSFSFHLGKVQKSLNRPLTFALLALHAMIIIGLVVLQGDLGSALVFVFLFLAMLFSSNISLWYFLGMGVVGGIASPFLWKYFLQDYQKERILCGLDPTRDPLGYGYQALCSRNAISNGGFSGMGYLKGEISQNPVASALPARQTDMIFAVLGEELGFVGIMVYLLLLIVLVFRILSVAQQTRGSWGSFICIGIAAIFICQALENIGMCLGLLPVIGLTLPFMSYGGSSVVTLFVAVGLVESVKRHHDTTFSEVD